MPTTPSKVEKFLKKAHKNLAHSFFEQIASCGSEAAAEGWRKGDAKNTSRYKTKRWLRICFNSPRERDPHSFFKK